VRVRLTPLLVILALVAVPQEATAVIDPGTTFVVNSTGDGDDSNPGNNVCSTGGTACSLRAALTESNADTDQDTIHFTPTLFDGSSNPNSTLLPAAPLPAITEAVIIDGGDCGTLAVPKPCVGLGRDPAGATILDVQASNVTVRRIAFVGGATNAVLGTSGVGLDVRGSWFGLKLDGSAPGFVGDAIRLVGASGATIGGTTPGDRNVIVRTFGVKLESDDNRVLGNYFGVSPSGVSDPALRNSNDVRIFAVTPPAGNVIGDLDAGTPGVCDGGCNLFSDASGHAIQLDGDPVNQTAGETAIAGNFVGIGLDGSDRGATLDSIFVGDASDITIGGPTAASRNYIGASDDDGIDARAAAANLAVLNNFIGLRPDGHGAAPITDRAVIAAGDGAQIRDNRIGGLSVPPGANKPLVGIHLSGDDGEITGNVLGVGVGGEDLGFSGGAEGIRIEGVDTVIGGTSPADANTIGFATQAIDIFGNAGADRTQVLGNFIGTDASGADLGDNTANGIQVVSPTLDVVIGGESASGQNVISNLNGEPIVVLGPNNQQLTIGRNLGLANGQSIPGSPMFAEFGLDGLGLSNNNGNLAPPQIAAGATSEAIAGIAPAGAKVMIYATPDPAGTLPVDLSSFVAETTADAGGTWSVTCPSAACADELRGPGVLTANSTDAAGNSSDFPHGVAFAPVAPETAIDSGPAAGSTVTDATPTFGFSASESTSTFECRIDADAFAACSGPGAEHTTPTLGDGLHTFEVRAVDDAGNVDATPATRAFAVDVPDVPTPSPPAPDLPAGDNDPPQTSIEKAPKRKSAKRQARFAFSSDELGSSFECKLDKGQFIACAANAKFKVKPGKHRLEVRASDVAGNVDPTPAKAKWKVRR
jgi:CSLREA domain-containing protein